MSEDGGPTAKRTKLLQDDYEKLSREELLQRLCDQDTFIQTLQAKQGDGDQGPEDQGGPKDVEDKLKQQQVEATRRENVLVMRLTTKEQEMQEYLNQIAELKQVRNPATTQLRGMMLDPAINLMFQRMKKEMDSCKEKLEQAQNDLAAWKFTPDSQTGKRLMAKCRMLLQENEELGKMISAGRTAKLEGEIALEKKFVEEMKKSQAETDEFLTEMDEDMEGMQSTIYFLQQQLKDAKDEVAHLRNENAQLLQQQQQQQQRQQQTPPLTSPAFPKDEVSRDSTSTLMDVDSEPDRDSSAEEHCDTAVEVPRTTNVGLESTYPPHPHTGNNMRTNESEVTSSGSVTATGMADHRTVQPSSFGALPNSTTDVYSHDHQKQQQSQHTLIGDGKHDNIAAANGNHATMEMDLSDPEPSSSCEDEIHKTSRNNVVISEQNNCRNRSPVADRSPRSASPKAPASPSNAYNHGQYNRVSQSSDGAYTPGTDDGSNDTWSPSHQSKHSGMLSDDDQKDPCRYRTDNKGDSGPERLQNGLVVSSAQYEVADTEMTAD